MLKLKTWDVLKYLQDLLNECQKNIHTKLRFSSKYFYWNELEDLILHRTMRLTTLKLNFNSIASAVPEKNFLDGDSQTNGQKSVVSFFCIIFKVTKPQFKSSWKSLHLGSFEATINPTGMVCITFFPVFDGTSSVSPLLLQKCVFKWQRSITWRWNHRILQNQAHKEVLDNLTPENGQPFIMLKSFSIQTVPSTSV